MGFRNFRKYPIVLPILLLSLAWLSVRVEGLRSNRRPEVLVVKQVLGENENENYELDILPDVEGGPVNVQLDLYMYRIFEINMVQQFMSSSFSLCLKWNDSRLVWDGGRNSLSHISISPSSIWTPDIALANSYENSYTTASAKRDARPLAHVTPSGEVKWCPKADVKSSCTIDGTYYPYDTQTCVLKFRAPDYYANLLNITAPGVKNFVDLSSFYMSSIYDVMEAPSYFNYYADPPSRPESDVSYYITLRRRAGGLNPAFPLITTLNIFNFLAILAFLLPNDRGTSIRLGLPVLSLIVGMGVFFHVTGSIVPSSFILPVVVRYILYVIGFNLICILVNIGMLRVAGGSSARSWNFLGKYFNEESPESDVHSGTGKVANFVDIGIFCVLLVVLVVGNVVFLKCEFPSYEREPADLETTYRQLVA